MSTLRRPPLVDHLDLAVEVHDLHSAERSCGGAQLGTHKALSLAKWGFLWGPRLVPPFNCRMLDLAVKVYDLRSAELPCGGAQLGTH